MPNSPALSISNRRVYNLRTKLSIIADDAIRILQIQESLQIPPYETITLETDTALWNSEDDRSRYSLMVLRERRTVNISVSSTGFMDKGHLRIQISNISPDNCIIPSTTNLIAMVLKA